ncbi:HEAT repeat domain-containing protein [Nocardia abscessus]|uniref:HEAT repeat domain-containing protein n=1 Tax=Nocardia abscessus TaxID=120957 RepID=UPI00189324A0|nr:HEAT repeat domain-containing protein [Nocardia abscessus]MBF6341118.1 HEAT repeat domain-containing protein [Nocardia abscessus]
MALMVHLTPEKNARRIRRAGIAANGFRRGVFCMPVMPSYVLSHQWLRELRRGGQRLIVAVDFRIPDNEPVLVGHYGAAQTELTAAEAVSVILQAGDARGYEILVPRAIAPVELRRIRPVRQVTGWRYHPNAHGQRPCACPACLRRGEFKAADLRRRFATDESELTKPQLLARLREADNDDDLIDALYGLARRSRGDVVDVAHLIDHPNPEVRCALASALRRYRGSQARGLLARLAADPDSEVRDAATQ